jgi:hypothetical protein
MVIDPTMAGFDFPVFRTALEAKDVATWLTLHAEDAERVEDRHDAPPRASHRVRGDGQTGLVLSAVAAADIDLVAADEVIRRRRVAFAVTTVLPGGRRLHEHVILHLRGVRITRQVDVRAWD